MRPGGARPPNGLWR